MDDKRTGESPRAWPGWSATLALALLASVGLQAFVAPAQAAPSQESADGTAASTAAVTTADGPRPHFGYRILGQATPTVAVTATVTETPTPTLTTTPGSPTATPGSPTATATIGAPPPQPPSGTPGVPCTSVVGGTCTAAGAVNGTWTKVASGTFTFTAQGSGATALVGVIPTIFIPTTVNPAGEQFPCSVTILVGGATTTTCSGTTAGDILQGATITVAFPAVGGGFVTSTGIVTGSNPGSLTTAQAITQAQATAGFVLGGAGFPCATQVGQSCTVSGAVTGSLTRTGSMSFSLTATLPAGTSAFITPVAVFSTDQGIVGVACPSAVTVGTTTYTCTGTIAGNVLQGSTVALCFQTTTATTICVLGTAQGTGGGIFPPNFPPLPPPPPFQFFPPPPPPPWLLPPPPPAPLFGAAPFMDAYGGVPVVPEADSLVLLVGGLVALGGVAALRRRRAT